jgi:Flp pilus assembly protein TadD
VNLEQLQAAFAANPSSTAYYELIARYVELGRVVEALVVAKKAVAARPDDATTIRTYGWVLLVQNKVDRALNELGRALQIAPGDYEARFLYALGLERQERLQEAEIQIDYVLAAHPEHAGAGLAKTRLGNPKEEVDETRQEVVEKTIMMAAVDILSSRNLTGSFASELSETEAKSDGLAEEAAHLVDEGIKARQDKEAAAASLRNEVDDARQAARQQLEEFSGSSSDLAPEDVDLLSDPEAPLLRKKAMISLVFMVLVVLLLTGLYTSYSAWAKGEQAIQDRFTMAERSFVKHKPNSLMKSFRKARQVVDARPNHHLAIGLAAHAAARLASEYAWPEGWTEAEEMLKRFPAGETSVHHRAAKALIDTQFGRYAEAMAALDLTAHGRKIDLPVFKNLRGLTMHRQGRNAEARKAFQSSVSDGADHPQLNFNLSRFEFETGHPGVAQAYAGRLLAAADQARGEAQAAASAAYAQAKTAAKAAKTEAPAKAKEIGGATFAAIEHGPALLLRSAAWLVRKGALAQPALGDLGRAIALTPCGENPGANCAFAANIGLAHALQSVVFDRLGQSDKARTAQSKAGEVYNTHPWSLLARAYLKADQNKGDEAVTLAQAAGKLLPNSVLPTLAEYYAQTRKSPPSISDEGLTAVAQAYPSLKGQAMILAAEIQARKGDKEGALTRIDRYRDAFPAQALRARLHRVQVLRWAKAYDKALEEANETLGAAIKGGRMNLGHAALIEVMRLEIKRGGRGSAKRAFSDLSKDNPNHTEALYLAATILNDNEAKKHLQNIAPGSRWAMMMRKE